MTLLAKHSIIKEDKSNIITLGAIAKEEKNKNPNVVNATIGMLYGEDGNLFTFKSVDKALSLLTAEEKYAYSSTPGNKDFHEVLKEWVFRNHYEEIKENMFMSVMATPGGSGAISNTFSNYLNPNEKVLLPNYMWGNYKQFAYENFQDFDTYQMFNSEGEFNLEDVRLKMQQHKENQGRVLLVINDPCHNPTGYTMSYAEWQQLIDIINDIAKDNTPIILLYDMAYIDYDYRGFEATRENIRLFQNLDESVLTVLAFSGSKTLALYGMRIGAQIALSKNKDYIDEFFQANKFSSRSKWSTTTNMGMNIISKVLSDAKLKEAFEKELEESRQTLVLRANTFLEESIHVGLETLPFKCGFFVTIPCDNPNEVYERLLKHDIHVIPLGNVIRVTIASITVNDCRILPKIIKTCL